MVDNRAQISQAIRTGGGPGDFDAETAHVQSNRRTDVATSDDSEPSRHALVKHLLHNVTSRPVKWCINAVRTDRSKQYRKDPENQRDQQTCPDDGSRDNEDAGSEADARHGAGEQEIQGEPEGKWPHRWKQNAHTGQHRQLCPQMPLLFFALQSFALL